MKALFFAGPHMRAGHQDGSSLGVSSRASSWRARRGRVDSFSSADAGWDLGAVPGLLVVVEDAIPVEVVESGLVGVGPIGPVIDLLAG